jgi:hypothetical protein
MLLILICFPPFSQRSGDPRPLLTCFSVGDPLFPTIHKIPLTSPLFPPILLILTPLFCGLLIVSAGWRYKILNPILTAESTPDMIFIKRENIEAISTQIANRR